MVLDALELVGAKVSLLPANSLFSGAGDLPILECTTAKCRALIALQGAQLLSFCPTGEDDLLWLSPLESFEPGKAIRGGIPLCLPWFGLNRRAPELPKHGFARNQSWTLDDVAESEGGDLRLSFKFQPCAEDLAIFPWSFTAQLDVLLSDTLQLTLNVSNEGDKAMPLSFAMHSYFAVSALAELKVAGVTGVEYLDNCQQLNRFRQDSDLRIAGEVDRVYESVVGEQIIHDCGRQIVIGGAGCDTVIVWNPGKILAETIADVGSHFDEYLCVERGMAFADELSLAAGEQHQATMTLAVQRNAD